MTDQPAEAWFERRISPAAVLALLILAGICSWLGWYAYRGELGRILSATPAIEVDLKPHNPPSGIDDSTASDATPSVVMDLTPPQPASMAASPAAVPPVAPAPAPAPGAAAAGTVAANTPGASEPSPAAPAAGASGSTVLSAPVLLPAPSAPGGQDQTVASATAPPDNTSPGNTNPDNANTASTAIAPAPAAPPSPATGAALGPAASTSAAPPPAASATGSGNASSIPEAQLLTSAPVTGGSATASPPASGAAASGTPANATAPQPATPQPSALQATTPPVPTPPAPAPAANTSQPAPITSTPIAPTTTTTTPAATPPAATPPAALAATTQPTETTSPEPSAADLLSAIGKAPAPVTQKMVIASATPPAGTIGNGAANGGAATSGAAGGTQQASVIDTFMQQSNSSAPPWQRYARPFDVNDPRPRIAIVITKLGLLHGTTLAAIDQLPADITLSFSPYASDLGQWIAHARSLGHEVMLDLPMESSQSGADPGPNGMLTTLSTEENLQRLAWVSGRADGYVGFAGVLGDRFTTSPVGLRPVLRDIARRGLMFLDPHLTADSVASSEATKLHLPRAIADLTIDDRPDRVSIDTQLAELERRARITGFAIGIANGYPVTIERLADWARSLAERNLALAPVSAIADQQADR